MAASATMTSTTTSSQPAALLSGNTATSNAVVTKQDQRVLSSSVVRAASRLWSRALATPFSLALTVASAATSYAARALAAAGCPPEGYVTSLKLREAMTVIDHMSYREEQYRLRLAALKEEADTAAREKRRVAAKLQRARAEVAELAAAANAAANAAAMASAAATRSNSSAFAEQQQQHQQRIAQAAAATTSSKPSPGSSDLGHPRGRPSPLVHATSAVAACAVLWFHRAGVDTFPPLAHKVVTAVAAPAALLWLLAAAGRPMAPHAALYGVGFFLMGYCASHWVALGAV